MLAEGDVLAARGYRHPALDGRTVVRLVPEALGEAEDLALEYLGFAAEGGERVGRVARQSLGFPAWALVHDPANGRHALAVVKEMERLARMAATKPGHAKEGFDEIATRLDRSVPHFLPTYYEQVARLFVAAESPTYASSFFGKARDAERRHALEVDEERLREVFLEFAAAGALSGKTLREQAKGLAERLDPAAAFEQFRVLCLERGAAGLAPYAGMVEDLRRLAKAAGRDVFAEEVSLVTELLPSGTVARAPQSFWKTVRPALVAAARQSPAVRARLLHVLPTAGDRTPAAYLMWLDTLAAAGSFALLTDPAAACEEAPGAAEWLGAWAWHRQRGYWRRAGRIAAELDLVERLARGSCATGSRSGSPPSRDTTRSRSTCWTPAWPRACRSPIRAGAPHSTWRSGWTTRSPAAATWRRSRPTRGTRRCCGPPSRRRRPASKDPAIWSGSPRTRCSGRSPGPGSPSGRRIWAVRSDCRSWSGS